LQMLTIASFQVSTRGCKSAVASDSYRATIEELEIAQRRQTNGLIRLDLVGK
jgi:hypothetical protein